MSRVIKTDKIDKPKVRVASTPITPDEMINLKLSGIVLGYINTINASTSFNTNNYDVFIAKTNRSSVFIEIIYVLAQNNTDSESTIDKLNWQSIHFRRYHNEEEFNKAFGYISSTELSKQILKPYTPDIDIDLTSISSEGDRTIYSIDNYSNYTVTLFTESGKVDMSNTLPNTTLLNPVINEWRTVIERT